MVAFAFSRSRTRASLPDVAFGAVDTGPAAWGFLRATGRQLYVEGGMFRVFANTMCILCTVQL